jgi:hypothetical protein
MFSSLVLRGHMVNAPVDPVNNSALHRSPESIAMFIHASDNRCTVR